MYRKISRNIKIAAIRLYERYLFDLDDILDICNISESTWSWILRLYRETGDVVGSYSSGGGTRTLNADDVQYLVRLIHANPNFFLDELLSLLEHNRFISIHFTTIHWELERAGISHKKLQRIAAERDEEH
jgi:transposase